MTQWEKSVDASRAGVGDLAVALWISEGARQQGEEVAFVTSQYDKVVEAFGHRIVTCPTAECMQLGGSSHVYQTELDMSDRDYSARTFRWQRSMDWSFVPCRPQLSGLSQSAVDWARDLVEDQPVVIIAPRAAHGSRSLPIQKWIRTAWLLHDEGVRTIAIDSQKQVVEAFPFFAFGYDWQHILALLSLSAVVAANDSGVAHLSATIGKRTVVAIGPTVESIVFGHCQDVVRSVASPDVECFGCHFKHQKGYRVACDHGCEALAMISWRSI